MTRDLRPLFDPRSVAIVGASNDPLKWGYGLSRGALRGAHRRAVYLVNRNGGEVQGVPAHRSLEELPEAPELVVVAVPEPAFEDTVDAALESGARAIVGITAGLGEVGPEGRAREAAVAARVRAAGALLLGPNCLGVFDAGAELDVGWNELPRGAIGLISQSGNLALELALLAEDYDLGFSRFASLGNQADLEAADLVAAFAADEATKVISLYVEDFRNGRAFASACAAAVAAGTPVVLLAAARTDASARAASSHTGAFVSDAVAVDAACRAAGIVQVASPRQLIDTAQALLANAKPRGYRLAVFGDGGGHVVIAADLAAAAGFELRRLSEALQSELFRLLGPTASTGNPVDLAGGGERDLSRFESVVELLLGSGEVDAVLLTGYFGGYATYGGERASQEAAIARAMASAAAVTGRALVVHTMYPSLSTAAAFRAEGIPVYREIEASLRSLARLVELETRDRRGVPALPAPAPALEPEKHGDYFAARALLEAGGLRFAPASRVTTLEEARDAAAQLGYPVVLKGLGLLHKSDAGGVVLGIDEKESLARAFSDLTTRFSPRAYSVERMAPSGAGIELIAGVRRDPRFGPVVVAGIGGIYAELLADVAVALAPIDQDEAMELICSLRGAPLLLGARGRPRLGVEAAASAVAALSVVAAAHPEIADIEVNPLLVTPDEAIGLDARILLEAPILPEEGDGRAC
jgi:acyl-CoA synthetase (NDP forming)